MWDDPPAQVTGLRDVLADLAVFTTADYDEDDQVHYPFAEPAEGDDALVFPLFVIAFDGRRSIKLYIIDEIDGLSIGDLQTLAHAIADQAPSVYRQAAGGLLIAQDPEVSDVGEPSEGMVAGDARTNAIEITFTIGLQRG